MRHPKDVDTIEINGVQVVIANGKGVTLANRHRLQLSPVAGWVRRIPKGTAVPPGLRLINDRPGDDSLCPDQTMPMDEFKGLLSKWPCGVNVYKCIRCPMAEVLEVKVSLLDWEARIVLECIERELQRLRHVTETSDDEDAVADAGNDHLLVVGLKERLQQEATAMFGKHFIGG